MAVLLSTALFETESKDRRFYTVDEIKRAIVNSKNYKLDGTNAESALPLLLYQTRIQQTWLVKTVKRLYCLLDDCRKPEPNVNWSMAMSEVLDQKGHVKLPLKVTPARPGETSGKIDIGSQHRDWLYSAKLFTVRPVDEEVKIFLEKDIAPVA